MKKQNNSGMLIGILIGIIIMLAVAVGLFATGTIEFKTTTTTDNEQTNENNIEKNNEQNLEMIDYSKFIGTYLNEGKNSLDDVSNNGGVVLKITNLSKDDISFEIQCISKTTRIAAISMKEVKNIIVNDESYSFSWFDDGWGNSGIGTISIVNNEIKLSITTEKYADNANWSMGKFEYIMHKVS